MRISDWSADVCSSDLRRSLVPIVRKLDVDGCTGENVEVSTVDVLYGGTAVRDVQGLDVGEGNERTVGSSLSTHITIHRIDISEIAGAVSCRSSRPSCVRSREILLTVHHTDRKSTSLNSSH